MALSLRTIRVARHPRLALAVVMAAATGGIGVERSFASPADPAPAALTSGHYDNDAEGSVEIISVGQTFHRRNFEPAFLICPANAPHVVGGGAAMDDPRRGVLNVSIPLAGPVPADGWQAAGYAPNGSGVEFHVVVLCAV